MFFAELRGAQIHGGKMNDVRDEARDEALSDFLVESAEGIARLDQDLITLEKNPYDTEVLKRIFRDIHSIKGTCGMFGFIRLERIAHAAEDVLSHMREGSLIATPNEIGIIFKALDVIKIILKTIETTKDEPKGEDNLAISLLRNLINQKGKEANGEEKPLIPQSVTSSEGEQVAAISEQSLRVNVDVLDRLMNSIGELVLTRNQLVQLVSQDDESHYLGSIQQLNRITSGLQQAVMKTRMQPVGNAWSKLPRIIRDLSQSIAKQIDLKMTGQETEIDRQILQAIHDPLIHCVRNSADHGIESSEIRKANGKSQTGTISLNAYHESGHIIIEIKDDGGGINVKAVKEKAIERGLLRAEDAEKLSDKQICQFIFEPGFSTATQVTGVSGRGVGMDVVRTNIEKIGGEVDITSEQGIGTATRIKIPLTMAIVSALTVKIGSGQGEVFAVPQVGVVELVRVSENNVHLVEKINNSRVLKLRERILPLIDLGEILGVGSQFENENAEYSIVVAQVNDLRFGIIVREIFDTQEIVVKPIARLLRDLNLYTGSTILGDGRVVIILDMARLAARVSTSNAGISKTKEISVSEKVVAQNRDTLLVFRTEEIAPKAVPLSMVSRLEEFPLRTIENINGRLVVQYRGELLPLCSDGVDYNALVSRNAVSISALIFSDGENSVGLLATEISDTVDEVLVVDKRGARAGISGIAVVQGKATEIVDITYYLQFAGRKPESTTFKIAKAS